jgi:hypothetical protein
MSAEPRMSHIYIYIPARTGIRRHIRSLLMRTKAALLTLVFYGHLMQMITCEDFIDYSEF